MAGSSVLKEFLVKIGFKIDETKYRDFQEAMRTTAKNAVDMSKNAIAATTVMGAGLRAVAQQMEGLYFATRRTGASVGELKELSFAAEQIGVSAEQARGAVEGLAASRRTNPGLNGILGGLGIDPKQTDNAKVLVQLLTRLHSMPYYQGAQIAGMFGINEQTFAMLEQGLPEMRKYLEMREKMFRASGINPDDIGKRSHEFSTHLRTLEAALGTLTDIIAYRLMPWGEKVIDWLMTVVGWLTRADSATGGWSSKLLGIATALAGGGLVKGGLGMLGKMLGRGGATTAAGSATATAAGSAATTAAEGAAAAGAEGAAATAAGGAATGVGEVAAGAGAGVLGVTGALVAAAIGLALIVFNRGIAEKIADFIGIGPHNQATSNAVSNAVQSVGKTVSGGLSSFVAHFEGFSKKVYQDVAGHATAFFGHKMAPGESLAGRSPGQVLASDIGSAMAAVHRLVKVHLNKNQESALADFVFNLGANSLAKSTLLRKLNAGDFAGAANQFQYWNHALVNGHMTALQALTERRAAEANLFRTPDRAITIQQKADYHIASTDPHGAASEVRRRQAQVNADMVRNLAGAVQ